MRESSSVWSILEIASSAAARVSKETYPNPRGRPESRWTGRNMSVTFPNPPNVSRSLFSSVAVMDECIKKVRDWNGMEIERRYCILFSVSVSVSSIRKILPKLRFPT